MKVKIEIVLNVPDDMQGVAPWSVKQTVFSYVKHWLEEGYYCGDYQINLPDDIEYQGFEMEWENET